MTTGTAANIDAELATLQSQIATLRRRRANLSTALLAHPNTSTILNNRPRGVQKPAHRTALSIISKQAKRNTQTLHRALAGCTAYKVQDPDPHAVDSGRVLGVQIEVFVDGAFLPSYHILLNRPDPSHPAALKIHKHTLPPCIPLNQLARVHLPQPEKGAGVAPPQDLHKLVRAVRKEVQSWHLRRAAVDRLREEVGLPSLQESEGAGEEEEGVGEVLNGYTEPPRPGPRRKGRIVDIEADLAVQVLTIEWKGGLSVRMRVSKSGEVEKGVARWRDGERDASTERAVAGRIEGVVERLGGQR